MPCLRCLIPYKQQFMMMNVRDTRVSGVRPGTAPPPHEHHPAGPAPSPPSSPCSPRCPPPASRPATSWPTPATPTASRPAGPPRSAQPAQLVQNLHPQDRGPRGTHQGAIIANGSLYCPCAPRTLLDLGPLGPAAREQAAAHDPTPAPQDPRCTDLSKPALNPAAPPASHHHPISRQHSQRQHARKRAPAHHKARGRKQAAHDDSQRPTTEHQP
jgi:hypothetical protein